MSAAEQLSFDRGLPYEIQQRGYAEFEHGIPNDEIEHAVETYTDFTRAYPNPSDETMSDMLPETYADFHKQLDELDRTRDTEDEWHKYRTNIPGLGKPDGYTNRSFQVQALKKARGVGLKDDPKEYFHYSRHWLSGVNRIHIQQEWGPPPPEIQALDDAFKPIHVKASALITHVASIIEETHPEVRNLFSTQSLARSPIRLLFYHPSTQGDAVPLGEGHYDKGALTLQLAESHKGLRVAADKNAPLELVERNDTHAAFFPGIGLAESVTDPENTPFQAAWHDIIRTTELNHGRVVPPKAVEFCARWALIFFANGANFRQPDKKQTHTR